MKFNVFICLLCCALHGRKNVLGQQEDSLFIQGAVVDTVTNAREFRLVVYNRSQNEYLTTTATGRYSGYVANNDTLVIEAVGYDPILFVVESKGKRRVEPVHYLALYFKTFEDVYVFKEKSVEVLQRQRETLAKKQLDNGGGGTLILSSTTGEGMEKKIKN